MGGIFTLRDVAAPVLLPSKAGAVMLLLQLSYDNDNAASCVETHAGTVFLRTSTWPHVCVIEPQPRCGSVDCDRA